MKSLKEVINQITYKYAYKLTNDLAKKVEVRLEDAAYDTMQEFYDYKPKLYQRTDNLRLNSYEKFNTTTSKNSHKKGQGGENASRHIEIEFSPKYMSSGVYFESKNIGRIKNRNINKYTLDKTKPIPKDHIFSWTFLGGYHGNPDNELYQITPNIVREDISPYESMQKKYKNIRKWTKAQGKKMFEEYQKEMITELCETLQQLIGE